MKRKWKALGIAALLLLTGGTVWAFSEVSLLVQAVSGKVDVKLEEFTREKGKLVPWKENQMVLPGGVVSKIARISNEGEECYIRTSVIFDSERKTEKNLTRENLTGISKDWVWKGDYCYYRKILKKEGQVDFFQGIQIPETWTEEKDDDNRWTARVKVDAIQAAFFQPDFDSEDPWGIGTKEYEIKEAVKEKPVEGKGNQEPVICEIQEEMKGFSVDSEEFFRELETFLPGKSQTCIVRFENKTKNSREIFLRTEILEENDFLKKLELKIQKRIKGKTEVLYQGTLLADQWETYQSIGNIPGKEQGMLEFQISLPQEADNRYSAQQGKIRFWFTTDTAPEKTSDPSVTVAKTGDERVKWPWITAILSSGVFIIAVWKKRYGRW